MLVYGLMHMQVKQRPYLTLLGPTAFMRSLRPEDAEIWEEKEVMGLFLLPSPQ